MEFMNNQNGSTGVAAEPKMLVIELVNQQESNYFLDARVGDIEGMDGVLPRAISFPSARKIKSRSRIKHVVNGIETLREIRYIKGCDTPFVDEQEKAGYKVNPQEDVIWIFNARLMVFEKGIDVGKYRYLKLYEGNVSNEKRPDGAEDIFKEIDTSIEAKDTENTFDAEFEVLKYLNKLKTKVSETETRYDENTLEFLCSLFKLPPFDTGFKSEAWVALATAAKEDPENFLKRIAAERSNFESDVNKAVQLGAVIFDDTRAVFAGTNKFITQFPENISEGERIEMLVDFMSNPKNAQLYTEMRTQVNLKREVQSGVVE